MPTPATASYGSWPSPLAASTIARGAMRLVDLDITSRGVFWIEVRPAEHGRYALVHRGPDGVVTDVTPADFNVRSRVHEYGGGACLVTESGIFLSRFDDQRLYRLDRPGEVPRPITPPPPEPAALRYADATITPDGGVLVCVRERHDNAGVTNEIVALPADGSAEPSIVLDGNDFYASPRVSPDGRRIAWTTWNHPLMPWDGCELWVGDLLLEPVPRIDDARQVAGGPGESAYQPSWTADGTVYFLADPDGWLNIHRLAADGTTARVLEMEAEFGWPQWSFGSSSFAALADGRLACAWMAGGEGHLGLLDPASGGLQELELPYRSFWRVRSHGMRLAVLAGGPREAPSVVTLDLETTPISRRVLRRAFELPLRDDATSVPEPIEFPTDGGLTAHALFYAPVNPHVTAPADERPPLLVLSHGGPTDATEPMLDARIQFWTSRGLAVADVNYGGSSGYGRAYRERLKGQWGVVDVADCVNAARHLVGAGRVDPRRMAIRGGSAGGYTTLCALTFFDVFAAGASYFGVADLTTFVGETHKFESRYLDSLVGPYPETADRYQARSPVNFTDRLSCPIIVLQGLEDEIVPPSQAELMVAALKSRGIPHVYLAFEGEQHGFRRAETIQAALEAELSFYAQVFGFVPADDIEPVALVR